MTRTSTTGRTSAHSIDPLFLNRWSPRAFDASVMPPQDFETILEAASWAPSAFNYQPWRFLYAYRGSADWQRFLDLLMPFNASWAERASVLVFVLSDSMMEGSSGPEPSLSHSFDAGAAWAFMALQAMQLGYHSHGMSGILLDKIRSELAVPECFRIEAAIAIGRKGDPSVLSEKLQAREIPSHRRAVSDIAFAGNFPVGWLR